ncbi:MAG: glutamyl-tRNA(Gln) amidotransferase subunit [Euryarchaeota archaeon]|nr:glutamyl-tRNA(Gln) amidotransferase subunit [Euryarchaeota archaeon]
MAKEDSPQLDYHALGLICGIEIHQQLDTACKLFCGCPTKHREVEESNFEFFRYLRPSRSELGEIDRAALEEVLVSRKFIYKSYDSTCLVEADEEPPREINAEALEISLIIARLLNMKIVDELEVMRKMVIDGSNTSGFQRTGYVGSDGWIETSGGRVGIGILCLEEEAARIIEDRGDSVVYSLDRLGIPLVEIGTAPDIFSPAHAREVASYLGMILRSTGRVKRGLGTIRQDVNVSIKGGARVEVKGVQALNLVDKVVEFEALRQMRLLEIKNELQLCCAHVDDRIKDVTNVFAKTGSKVLARSLKNGGVVLACRLPGFAGLVGRELQPDRRLGSEMSDRAKRAGVGGIFHTDELPAYGVVAEEVSAVRCLLDAVPADAVVMVTGPRDRAEKALLAVLVRAREALTCVPEETRRALPDGCSEYMRPLPGSARMYPETDVPSVAVTEEMLAQLKLPELFADRSERFVQQYGLSVEQARVMAASPNYPAFEEIVKSYQVPASIVVRAMETTPIELARDGVPVANLTEQHYRDCFALLAQGKVAKEGLTALFCALAKNPEMDASEAAAAAGLAGVDDAEVARAVQAIVAGKIDFVRSKGDRAIGPLMGLVMKELRGKADGGVVSAILKKEIQNILNQ